MEAARLQGWWWHRQGLDGSLNGAEPARVLAGTGWARSVGGVGPYLSLFARCGADREMVDRAVAEQALQELPAARGCTYVVPASDCPLALAVGQEFSGSDMAAARKLGVAEREVDRLRAAILSALETGPLDPEEIRAAVGAAVRSLGEAGRKTGINSTLPLALGTLQAEGDIRRISANGRLDQQRYRYALWRPHPLYGKVLTGEAAAAELAHRYFDWTAPATLAEFQRFSGLGVKAAKAAVEPLGLEPLGAGGDRLLPAGLRPAFDAFQPPRHPQYALLGNLDAILVLRRNPESLLATSGVERPLPLGGGGRRADGSVMDLPSPAIFDRGRLIGLWEYDPEAGRIVWMAVVKPDAALRAAVARTEAFVRDQLGDARSFSLDSPKSRQPRIANLRQAAG